MFYKLPVSNHRMESGPFTIIANLPGMVVPGHSDHGWGPLARYDESIMRPGTFIAMHEHRNDEIISYVSDGALRHSDRAGNNFKVPRDQLMVMNAGKSFWHEEETYRHDPEARFLQIFVRPHSPDLAPSIQLVDPGPETTDSWRLLVGPATSDAPASVRNDVMLYDAHPERGTVLTTPLKEGWDTLIHVYRGDVTVNGQAVSQAEGALLVDEGDARVESTTNATVLVFLINRAAPVSHAGTIGR